MEARWGEPLPTADLVCFISEMPSAIAVPVPLPNLHVLQRHMETRWLGVALLCGVTHVTPNSVGLIMWLQAEALLCAVWCDVMRELPVMPDASCQQRSIASSLGMVV